MDLGDPTRRGTIGNGYVLEQFLVPISHIKALKIANAREVEARLGHDEFPLTRPQLLAFRDFMARLGVDASESDKLDAARAQPQAPQGATNPARSQDLEPKVSRGLEPDPAYLPRPGDVALVFCADYPDILAAVDFPTHRVMADAILRRDVSKLEELKKKGTVFPVMRGTRVLLGQRHILPNAPNGIEGDYTDAVLLEGDHAKAKVLIHSVSINRAKGEPEPTAPLSRQQKEIQRSLEKKQRRAQVR